GLDVNPSGFSEAHFATFPPKLIEPLIKAGTSEKGACASCGSPWERIVEKELLPTAKTSFNSVAAGRAAQTDGNDQGSNRMRDGHQHGWFNSTSTTGWRKSSSCETNETRPCVVLDPFAGAGTTLLVSKRRGRRSIGLELNPEYIKIAEHRLEH